MGYLQNLGVRFETRLNDLFEGTTLCATNDAVDAYNRRRLYRLPPEGTRVLSVESTRWGIPGPDGRQLSEWKQIPESFLFKVGAYVMILSDDTPDFRWVNGDCGTLVDANPNQFVVRLKRNGREVAIGKIIRKRTTRKRPSGIHDADVIVVRDEREYDSMVIANGEPPRQVVMLREPRPTWITGWVRYFPLRLAYASSQKPGINPRCDPARSQFEFPRSTSHDVRGVEQVQDAGGVGFGGSPGSSREEHEHRSEGEGVAIGNKGTNGVCGYKGTTCRSVTSAQGPGGERTSPFDR